MVDWVGTCQCRRRPRRRHPFSGIICPIPVLPLSARLLSVLSAACASLLAAPRLSTSTGLFASGGPIERQHRQTIEPTGAEPLAGSAVQSTTTSVLPISTPLLKDVTAPARKEVPGACRQLVRSRRTERACSAARGPRFALVCDSAGVTGAMEAIAPLIRAGPGDDARPLSRSSHRAKPVSFGLTPTRGRWVPMRRGHSGSRHYWKDR